MGSQRVRHNWVTLTFTNEKSTFHLSLESIDQIKLPERELMNSSQRIYILYGFTQFGSKWNAAGRVHRQYKAGEMPRGLPQWKLSKMRVSLGMRILFIDKETLPPMSLADFLWQRGWMKIIWQFDLEQKSGLEGAIYLCVTTLWHTPTIYFSPYGWAIP